MSNTDHDQHGEPPAELREQLAAILRAEGLLPPNDGERSLDAPGSSAAPALTPQFMARVTNEVLRRIRQRTPQASAWQDDERRMRLVAAEGSSGEVVSRSDLEDLLRNGRAEVEGDRPRDEPDRPGTTPSSQGE